MRATALIVLLASASAGAQESPRVYHVPPAEALPGRPFVVEATVSKAWQASLELRYRQAGGRDWSAAHFELDQANHWIATVPAADVRPPGFDYYIADKTEETHFASSADPWRVSVRRPAGERLVDEELRRLHGRRFRIHTAGELVNFGRRRLDPTMAPSSDYYYRIDADLTFRILRFPVREIRFGYTQLRGPARPYPSCTDQCDKDDGFQPGGWAEVRFRLSSTVDADVRGMAVAQKTGFKLGTRIELRAGREEGSHVAIGGETIGEVGSAFFFRLGWDTVPHLPMAATIEISNYPESHRETAVRLLYDVAYPMENGLRIGLRGGYQARDQGIGGATVGLNTTLDF